MAMLVQQPARLQGLVQKEAHSFPPSDSLSVGNGLAYYACGRFTPKQGGVSLARGTFARPAIFYARRVPTIQV